MDGFGGNVDVREYLNVLRKRWPIILACVLIGVLGAAALVKMTTKVYTASAQIFVAASTAASSGSTALNNGNSFAEARVQSYTSVANSPAITNAVMAELKLSMTADQLAGKISADAPLNKVLLNLHVIDESPVEAATIANKVAEQFVIYVEQIERLNAGLTTAEPSPVKLTVVHPAQVPRSPTSPNVKIDLAIGLLAGLLVGLGLAALRQTLDTRVRTVSDVSDYTLASVLAVVPADRRSSASPVAFRSDDRGQRAEAFRQLRTNLQYIDVDSPPKLIAITSAVSGEGKSTTAMNLAMAMAEAGSKVCLIDGDLRRPTIAKYLDLIPGVGLTTVLSGRATVGDVLQSVGPNLTVITSGPIPPNPSELLASGQFRTLLRGLADQTDYVVIDSAPLLPVADGREVASAADVSLLVVRCGRTNREQVKQATESLQRVGARLGGVVFNMVSSRGSGNYYHYYSSTEDMPEESSARS
jgi:capsular exopolysaccharide synthesis family protein